MFFIRVDANGKIGMGHLTRCLSIACALRDKGEDVCFVMADESTKSVVEMQGFSCELLGTDYSKMEEELDRFVSILKNYEKCLVLVDSYFVTTSYFKELRRYCKVAYMDDLGRLDYELDCVVNGNIYGSDVPYTEHAINRKMKCATGCAYTPLRSEFLKVQRMEGADRVLVTTGGSDPMHITVQMLQEILKREKLSKKKFDIVCGRFNQDVDEINKICKNYLNIRVYQDVKEMWTLMEQVGYAITAGGSTMYELAKMGIPMCSFSFVDNQERIVESFYEKNYSCYGGNYLVQGPPMIAELCDRLEYLLEDAEQWKCLSDRLMQLVDGNGSQRIAEQLSLVLRIS